MGILDFFTAVLKPKESWTRTGNGRWRRYEIGHEDDHWEYELEEKEMYSGKRRWEAPIVKRYPGVMEFEGPAFTRAQWFPKDTDPNDPLVDPELPESCE